jgi:hypothetical protein
MGVETHAFTFLRLQSAQRPALYSSPIMGFLNDLTFWLVDDELADLWELY